MRMTQVLIRVATGVCLVVAGCGKSSTGSSTDGGTKLDAPAGTGGSLGGSGGTATGGAGGALTAGNGGTTAGGAGGSGAPDAPAARDASGRTGGAGGSSAGSGGTSGSTSAGIGGSPGSGGSANGGTKGTGGVASTGGVSGTSGTQDVCGGRPNCVTIGCPGSGCFCSCDTGVGGARSTGGATGTGGGTGTGGAPGTGGATGAGGTGARIDGGLSACQIIDSLDRSCTVDADCVAVKHTSNCCGQIRYIGIRATEDALFAANEPACDAGYPPCGCAARQPMMDDDSVDDRTTVQAGVMCLSGTCKTFVRDCGKPCVSGTTCFSCSNHAQLFAACTTPCASAASSGDCTSTALPLCQTANGTTGNTYGTFCTAAAVACDTK